MANNSKKAKPPKMMRPTRTGRQIYMSDRYAKELDDAIDNREQTDLRKLMDKKISEKMYSEGSTPQEVGKFKAGMYVDEIEEAVRINSDKNKTKPRKKNKTKVRAFKNGGAVMSGRGPKFKGQT